MNTVCISTKMSTPKNTTTDVDKDDDDDDGMIINSKSSNYSKLETQRNI